MNVKHLVAVLTAMVVLAYGCATSNHSEDLSDDATRTRLQGCLGGLGFGAVIGYLLGDQEAENAAKGAVAGTVAGCSLGYVVSKRKSQYATQEAFLDAEIQNARDFNQTILAYNEQLKGEVAELASEAAELQERYQAELVSKEQFQSKLAEVQARQAEVDRTYSDMKEEYDILVAIYEEERQNPSADKERIASLYTEITRLNEGIAEVHDSSVQLAELTERRIL